MNLVSKSVKILENISIGMNGKIVGISFVLTMETCEEIQFGLEDIF